MITIDKSIAERIESLNVAPRWTAFPSIESTQAPNGTSITVSTYRSRCEIIDLATGKTILTAEGIDDESSLTEAMNKIDRAPRPKTEAELVALQAATSAENEALKAELAALKSAKASTRKKTGESTPE